MGQRCTLPLTLLRRVDLIVAELAVIVPNGSTSRCKTPRLVHRGSKPVFSTFPAGVRQIAASASKSWDVGGTGGVPAVLGHVRFGIKTIGVSNDESAGNALLVHKDLADGSGAVLLLRASE